jgi:hypothetical protein
MTPHCCIGVTTGEMCLATVSVAGYELCAEHAALLEEHGSIAEALASVRDTSERGAV